MSEQDLIPNVTEVDETSGIPVLPLRDVVVYPHMVIPLFVGREKSIVALDKAMAAGKRILLVAPGRPLRGGHARDDPAAAEAA